MHFTNEAALRQGVWASGAAGVLQFDYEDSKRALAYYQHVGVKASISSFTRFLLITGLAKVANRVGPIAVYISEFSVSSGTVLLMNDSPQRHREHRACTEKLRPGHLCLVSRWHGCAKMV